jgi:hypothetical protein
MTTTKLPMPLYTYVIKGSAAAFFLKHGDQLWMPIFTSDEYAGDFAQRFGLDCGLNTLRTGGEVQRHITRPVGPGVTPPPFMVVIDPIDGNPGTDFTLLRPEQFLDLQELPNGSPPDVKRSKAKPIIDRVIASRTWHDPPKPTPGMPAVKIDDGLLAGHPREPSFFDDIAAQIHLYDFPAGFEDEEPNAELLQERVPLERRTARENIALPAHVIFHDGKFWVGGTRFI